MVPAVTTAVCEIDDYPRGWQTCIAMLDRYRAAAGSGFCATIFCIAGEMTAASWAPLLARPWLRAGLHGWRHDGEARTNSWHQFVKPLTKWAAAGPYRKIFKAAHYGYSPVAVDVLRCRGWIVCLREPLDAVGVQPMYRHWLDVRQTQIGMRAVLLRSPAYTMRHRHTGLRCMTDVLHRPTKYMRTLVGLDWRWSEDVAEWI